MNAISNSRKLIKILNSTDTTVMDALIAVPIDIVINISMVSPITIECPAIIFAKRRIINENGLVMVPIISMACIKGMGAFSHVGTSGQKSSL